MMADFNPQMLILARKACGKTQAALATEAGISQAFLSKIENGIEPKPADHLVSRFADGCGVPESFFAQRTQPLGEGMIDFFHRKRLTLPAKPLERAQANANMIRLELGNLMRTIAVTDVAPFPAVPAGEEMTPEDAAALTRAVWRVPQGPLPDLVGLIEAAGIPVVSTSLGHDKLSAISMPTESGSYIIILNSDLPASSSRFTLAHELGHLVMHFVNPPSLDIEEQADRFASALLMPAPEIAKDLRALRFSDLGGLKQKWRVSLAALIRTAHSTGNLSDRQYRTFNIKLNGLPGGRRSEPGEFAAETPRFVKHIIDHYTNELKYSRDEVWVIMHTLPARARAIYLGDRRRILKGVGRPKSHLSLAGSNN
jgi:Zn-dependent peptidase ImmA (M78 family)/transcriptional regulator with XRE-family HTH domain